MASPHKARTVFQLANIGSWLENIAARSDGILLVTRVDAPELWAVDPATGQGSVVLTLPAPIKSLTGIAELDDHTFAVGVGQYDLAAGPVPGSFEVHTVTFSGTGLDAKAESKFVTKIPEAGLLNGFSSLNATAILGVDSVSGAVYKVDIANGTYEVVIQDELTKPPPGAPLPIGINGIKLWNNYVYFTNTFRQTVYRVPVDPASIKPTGPIEVVAAGYINDDLCFGTDGTAYVANQPLNRIVSIPPGAVGVEVEVVAGSEDSFDVGGPTAITFGRGKNDGKVLYVSTNGSFDPSVGQREPAKVVAIELA